MNDDKEGGLNTGLSRFFRQQICIDCGGTGTAPNTANKEICMRCDGVGYIYLLNKTGEVKIDIQT